MHELLAVGSAVDFVLVVVVMLKKSGGMRNARGAYALQVFYVGSWLDQTVGSLKLHNITKHHTLQQDNIILTSTIHTYTSQSSSKRKLQEYGKTYLEIPARADSMYLRLWDISIYIYIASYRYTYPSCLPWSHGMRLEKQRR